MKRTLSLILALALLLGASAAFAEGKTITYWTMWDSTEPQGIVLQKAVDKYMADTGNTVDLQFKGRTGIREGLQPALDAGMAIDLFDEDMDRVNTTWGAYLMDLEELAKANGYEASANAGLMAASRDSAGGTLKSIPYQPYVYAYFYNKDIFAEAGVTTEPQTWAEFLDVCEKVKAAGYIPVTCDDAYIMGQFGNHLARFIGVDGVRDVVMNGKWAEEPGVLKTAQAFQDLRDKGYLSPTFGTAAWPLNQNGEFALGDAAMYLVGSWVQNETKEMTGPDFNWGCFSYPAVDGGKDGIGYAVYGSQVYGINKNSQVAQEAFDLITLITKGEFDKMMADDTIGIPADSTNTDWPALQACVQTVMANLTNRYPWDADIGKNPDIAPILKENFQKLCSGALDAQGFVDAMAATK